MKGAAHPPALAQTHLPSPVDGASQKSSPLAFSLCDDPGRASKGVATVRNSLFGPLPASSSPFQESTTGHPETEDQVESLQASTRGVGPLEMGRLREEHSAPGNGKGTWESEGEEAFLPTIAWWPRQSKKDGVAPVARAEEPPCELCNGPERPAGP